GRWSETVRTRLEEQGTAQTLAGRLLQRTAGDDGDALAAAHRVPLVGSVSDFTKAVLSQVDRSLAGSAGRLVAATPGEVTVEVPTADGEALLATLQATCQATARQLLPLAPAPVAVGS